MKGEGKRVRYSCYFSTGLAFLGGSFLLLLAACAAQNSTGGPQKAEITKTPGSPPPITLAFNCRDNPGGGFYVNNAHGRVCVQTAPGAALTITIRFCNGAPDPSSELKGTVFADSEGYYEWNWKPQPDCKTAHIWKGEATVKAQLNGQSVSFATSFFGD